MRIDARDGIRGRLVDLDTGKDIEKPIWYDVEQGTFEAYQIGPDGKVLRNKKREPLTYVAVGRMRFIPDDRKPLKLPVPMELKPDSPVLRLQPPRQVRRCSHKGCTRVATLYCGDEVPLPYQIVNGVAFPLARTIASRGWCAFHYMPPRVLSPKGEVVEEIQDCAIRP